MPMTISKESFNTSIITEKKTIHFFHNHVLNPSKQFNLLDFYYLTYKPSKNTNKVKQITIVVEYIRKKRISDRRKREEKQYNVGIITSNPIISMSHLFPKWRTNHWFFERKKRRSNDIQFSVVRATDDFSK